MSLLITFDVAAWHAACAEHGLDVVAFEVPPLGSFRTLVARAEGRQLAATLFRGYASLWAHAPCTGCGREVALAEGRSRNTEAELAAELARVARVGLYCLRCAVG